MSYSVSLWHKITQPNIVLGVQGSFKVVHCTDKGGGMFWYPMNIHLVFFRILRDVKDELVQSFWDHKITDDEWPTSSGSEMASCGQKMAIAILHSVDIL